MSSASSTNWRWTPPTWRDTTGALPNSPGPATVARVIGRALTARHPRVRYAVGPESWAVPLGSRLLPDSVFLRFVRAHFGV